MRKSEIVTYMRGFVDCYNTMIDLIDDETEPKALANVSETSQDLAEPSQGIVKEEPEVETSANSSKPKPRTGTNVPAPKSVPHAPEKPKIQKIDRDKVCALLDAGWKVPKIAGEMHASEATIYNIQKQHREEKAKQEGQAGEL